MRSTIVRGGCIAIAMVAALATAMPAYADPPPWAPAHGWRAKQGKKHDDRGHDVVVVDRPVFIDRGGPVLACDRSMLAGNQELIGQILGGVAGAAAGSQFGQGTGKLAATAGGALLGLLIGGEIGASLDAADAACAQHALEVAPTGRTVAWYDPQHRTNYRLTPTGTFRSGDGYCREYRSAAESGTRREQADGVACRRPDGTWELRS